MTETRYYQLCVLLLAICLLLTAINVFQATATVFEDGSFILGSIHGCFPWAICAL